MTNPSGLELRSHISSSGDMRLSLEEVTTPELAADEVLIRVEAAPINPSDLTLLIGPADMSSLRSAGTSARPITTAAVPQSRIAAVAARLDKSVAVGLEGAGVVVRAGADVRGLIGRAVAAFSPGMYAQLRAVKISDCLVLPLGATARDGASAFVNPLSALSMVETMRREGHSALVHTAAASSLGQMLVRLCLADGVPLVNIVRSPMQVAMLRALGAEHVLDSTCETFLDDLADACAETGATLAFDAVGGGTLTATILSAMELALGRRTTGHTRYGSSTHKQVYLYGGLDIGATQIVRAFGMAWGVGGWLMTSFLEKIGPPDALLLRERVAAELGTTFASHYTAEISLAQALQPQTMAAYSRPRTGEKYLITPNGDLA